jgi:hypothetical protein
LSYWLLLGCSIDVVPKESFVVVFDLGLEHLFEAFALDFVGIF